MSTVRGTRCENMTVIARDAELAPDGGLSGSKMYEDGTGVFDKVVSLGHHISYLLLRVAHFNLAAMTTKMSTMGTKSLLLC